MRCLWEISIRSLLREIPQRPLTNISKEMSFLWRLYDVSNTSQKRCFFCDVFKTSQKHLEKDFFFVTSLRRLGHISRKMSSSWCLWDVSKASLASIYGFPNKKKIDVGPSEALKKWNVLWTHCIDINLSSLSSGLISTSEFWQVKDRQNQIVSVLLTTFSYFFDWSNYT